MIMSVDLRKMFKGKYVLSLPSKKELEIYSENQQYPFGARGFIMNELLYYLKVEGFGYGLSDKDDIIDSIEDIAERSGIKDERCIGDITDYVLSEYMREDDVKCIWVVIPRDVMEELVRKYKVIEEDYSISIISKSFDISVCYLTKFEGDSAYVGYVYAQNGYYALYKDYLDLGERVLCDDGWLTGRMFYGIKSDMFYLDIKLRMMHNKLKRIKRVDESMKFLIFTDSCCDVS